MDQQTRDSSQIIDIMNQEERIIRILEKVATGLDNVNNSLVSATASINSALHSCSQVISGLSEEIKDAVMEMKQAKQSPANTFRDLQQTSAVAPHIATYENPPTSFDRSLRYQALTFTKSSHFNIKHTEVNSMAKYVQMPQAHEQKPLEHTSHYDYGWQLRISPTLGQKEKFSQLSAKKQYPTSLIKVHKETIEEKVNELKEFHSSKRSDKDSNSSSQIAFFIQAQYQALETILTSDQSFKAKQTAFTLLLGNITNRKKAQPLKGHELDVLQYNVVCAKAELQLTYTKMNFR